MNNEKPTFTTRETLLSIRDIGKLGYAALQEMIAKWDEKYTYPDE